MTVHDRTLARFLVAVDTDDRQLLRSLLADDVLAVSDGGARLRVAAEPVRGRADVARFLSDLLSGQPDLDLAAAPVNGRTGVVVRRHGRVVAVLSLAVIGSTVSEVWISMNPAKMRSWTVPATSHLQRPSGLSW